MSASLDLRYIRMPHAEAIHSARELSPYEQAELKATADRVYQAGWIASRWLAKRIMLDRESAERPKKFRPQDVSILSRDDAGQRTAPVVYQAGQRLALSLSISHNPTGVLVGFARHEGVRLGVDLVPPGRIGVRTIEQWFTSSERRWMANQDDVASAARLLAVKQAFYKATNCGEPYAPRRYEVTVSGPDQFQCHVAGRSHRDHARIVVADCDGQVAALVVVLPDETAATNAAGLLDVVIPQTDLLRLGRM